MIIMKQVLRYFQIFEKWSPRRKFSLTLIFIYIVSVPVISIVTYFILKQNAIIAASNAARLYLYSIESTKRYIEIELRPILLKEIPDRFIIEGMSRSYVASHIAAGIQEKLPYYKYKNASLNPRNPNNKADEFETDVINEFISNKEKKSGWDLDQHLRDNITLLLDLESLLLPIVFYVMVIHLRHPEKLERDMA